MQRLLTTLPLLRTPSISALQLLLHRPLQPQKLAMISLPPLATTQAWAGLPLASFTLQMLQLGGWEAAEAKVMLKALTSLLWILDQLQSARTTYLMGRLDAVAAAAVAW